jgi:hypothetical protein
MLDVLHGNEMSKKARIKRERRDRQLWDLMSVHLTDEGLLCTVPLRNPPEDAEQEVRAVLKNHIRSGGIWRKLVELYGEGKASQVVADCRVHIMSDGV